MADCPPPAEDAPLPTEPDVQDRVDMTPESIMADYIESRERGQPVTPHDVIARHPEHAETLRSFFANDQWMQPDEEPSRRVLVGEHLGDFELVREIAQGGMGVVYEAIQTSLRRSVAVKLIGNGVLADDELRLRFRIEAEAAASLSHPHILPIHAIGCWQGMDYFVMPLVSGRSLQHDVDARRVCLEQEPSGATHLADGNDSRRKIRQAVTTVRDIARAVAYAHRRGIIHRDLKPDNVLIDGDGQPKIVDFGLAKWHRDEPQVTHDGQVLGTPHYMSPEQARGESNVTAATDVYSIGGLLFALLTGRPPHSGDSVAAVLASVLSDDAPSLRLIWPGGMPKLAELADLDNVIMRAMANDRADRYRSADELADDLDRVLSGDPTQAGPDGLVRLMTRELYRDQHQATFANWGRALTHIGIVVWLTHVLMFVIQETMPEATRSLMSLSAWSVPAFLGYFVPRFMMLLGIGGIIHFARDGLWMPRGIAERPVWSIWLGYLATLTVINVFWAQGYFDHNDVMVLAGVMSGFAFLAMAGHLWGGSAILGLLFFVVSALCVRWPSAAPLLLGTAWLVSMWVLGRRYGKSIDQ
ncbi:serine/threonine-protein kinase [Neorhodopirellula lusitana]|uniref:serine/threonine-protein kinase n=1 Tax=Neorhodopirellula lusitana TaxID=445327 RepID=UPI00384B1AB4